MHLTYAPSIVSLIYVMYLVCLMYFMCNQCNQCNQQCKHVTSNEVIRRLDEYSASLVIEHITSEHSGNYTCIAQNVAGTERFTVPLTVNVPPKWILEPKDSSAQATQDVYLHCQSSGYPKPTITWKKAIGPTPGEYKDFLYEPSIQLFPNGTIYFKKITKESQGHFLCEAKNNIGSGVSKVIFLKVNG